MRDEVAQEQAARQGADGIVAEGARQRGEDGREAEQPTDLVRARLGFRVGSGFGLANPNPTEP